MLPFLRKARPVVELLTYDEGVVGFRCEVPLVPGQRLQAVCRLPEGGLEFEGTLLVAEVAEVHRGTLEAPAQANEFLSALLPPAFRERRAWARLPKALRVLCRRVVGYKCTTTDLAPGGIGLLLGGPIPLGEVLALEIDADLPGIRGLSLEVEVLWALPPDPQRQHRVGTRCLALNGEQERTLARILEHLRRLSQP